MKLQLNSTFGDLIFEGDFSCMADLLKAAVRAGKALRYADLRSANLSSANLSSADLRYANLSYANLSSANLSSANLSSANLSSADLRYANLSYANLSSANLSSANLSSANLRYADLSETKGSKLAIAQTRILPEGALIGWKKCQGDVIVKLRIPEAAERSHAFGRKCRAEFVEVIKVYGGSVGISMHDQKTEYKEGETVKPDAWCEDYSQECASGIHFFITREEAQNYSY